MICIRILRKTPPLCTTLFFTYFAFANQLPGLSITGTLAANALRSSFFFLLVLHIVKCVKVH